MSVKQSDYVLASVALGSGHARVLVRHILPNTLSPVIFQASLGVGLAVIVGASFSSIGSGVQPSTPSWSSMVHVGFQYLETTPWFTFAPAGMIFFALLGFNLLGDGLRDAFDPTLQS